MNKSELISMALDARKRAYAPYSHHQVGAALMTKGGKVYTGCNIENVGFTPTICAERNAFFKAVSEGEMEFSEIVVVGGPEGAENLDYFPPCGVCRQVMMEFCDYDTFRVILAKSPEEYKEYALKEMLPHSFSPGMWSE